MIELGWTSEALLDEEERLLGEYDLAETKEDENQINGCLMAIQEVFLAQREVKIK